MACIRCGGPISPDGSPSAGAGGPGSGPANGWCVACERAYDAWSRRHAGDIVWAALAGTVMIAFFGMGLPLLGLSWLTAVSGVFAAFGAFFGLHRLNGRRRRRQYLRGGDVPRAYLPSRT